MDCPTTKITRIKLKRCEKPQSSDVRGLAKISCKIGDHFVNAHINSGSSISIASTDLYRKLVADKCTFKDGTANLNLVDESIPNQEYRVTTTTVKVIGISKSINLVTFPDVFTHTTTLGMDFLTTKSDKKSKGDGVFLVPEKPAPKSKPIHSKEINNENEPIALLDWILDTSNLKKPLYNILADGTADDDDLFAICAFMKRMPRMVSPIRSFEELASSLGEPVDTPFDKIDRAPMAPDSSSSNMSIPLDKVVTTSSYHDTNALSLSMPSTIALNESNDKAVSSSLKNDTAAQKTSAQSAISLDKPEEKDVSLSSKNQTSTMSTPSTKSFEKAKEKVTSSAPKNTLKMLTQSKISLDKAKEKVMSSMPFRNQTNSWRTSTSSTVAKERVISSSSKNSTKASRTSALSTLDKAKENTIRSTKNLNSYHRDALSKSGRSPLSKSGRS